MIRDIHAHDVENLREMSADLNRKVILYHRLQGLKDNPDLKFYLDRLDQIIAGIRAMYKGVDMSAPGASIIIAKFQGAEGIVDEQIKLISGSSQFIEDVKADLKQINEEMEKRKKGVGGTMVPPEVREQQEKENAGTG